MAKLELNISGNLPSELDLDPTKRVIIELNLEDPDWLRTGVINLKLVDDSEIQALNKDYSGNDYATDVLSFSYIEDIDAIRESEVAEEAKSLDSELEQELGDMVISLDTAKRQADEAGTKLAEEVATLALHGILHILGFDHAEPDQRAAMDALQAEILSRSEVTYRDFKWVSNE